MARKKLIELRKNLNLTQQEVADKVGISRQHYGRIEEGERNPSFALAIRIKDFFNYSSDEIFFNNNCDKMVQNKAESAQKMKGSIEGSNGKKDKTA